MSSLMKALMPTHTALMEAMGPDALGELQERIVKFQRKNFPAQDLNGKLEGMRREVVELQAAPRDRGEWADVFIYVLGGANMAGLAAAELIAIAHAKMAVNEKRKWGPPDAQGVYHHE